MHSVSKDFAVKYLNAYSQSGITLHGEAMYKPVYEVFIEAVDAVNNGVSFQESLLKYRSSTDLSSRVIHLNVR